MTGAIPPNGLKEKNRNYFLYLSPIYIFLTLTLLDAFIAPLLESRRLAVSEIFYGILKPVCHQWPTRCLWVFGSNTALCFRCLGIFFGLLLMSLSIGIKGVNRIYWKIAIVLNLPILIDGYTQLKGWHESTNFLRFVTGLLSGIGTGLFIFPMYLTLIAMMIRILKNGKILPVEEE